MARRRAGKKSSAPPGAPEAGGGRKRAAASGGPVGAIFRFLGSLKLAVALLLVWLAVLVCTTVLLEPARGSEVSQWYVYHSRWFLALMVLLAVNVSVAAVLRWPWKRRHLGFLIAHLGLLVLGAGSVQSFVAGVEGQLAFVEGQAADTILLSSRSQLTVSRSEGGAREELTFAFEPGPTDWPAGKPLDFGTVEGLRVKVLRFYRHARPETGWVESSLVGAEETTFQPAEVKPGDDEMPEAAALFEIAVAGETHEAWLQRASPRHGFERIQTANGPIDLSFGYAQHPLGFSLTLVEFTRGLNPGGMGDASYASTVRVGNESEVREISMNEPLTYGKFTFYQSSFDRTPDGRDVSRLSVASDPGRFLKYAGSLMVCAGTFVMFYWKRRRRGA